VPGRHAHRPREPDEAITLSDGSRDPATRLLLAEAGWRPGRPVDPDGVEALLDGLLDRVRDDTAARQSSSICSRPSDRTTPHVGYRKALATGCSDAGPH